MNIDAKLRLFDQNNKLNVVQKFFLESHVLEVDER